MKKIVLLAFCLCSITTFAQTLPEVDYPYADLIEKSNYEKAENKILKAYQKDSNDVLNCYAMYRLLSANQYINHNDNRAFAAITRAYKLFESTEGKAKGKLNKKNVTSERLLYEIGLMTEIGLQKALSLNNIAAYEFFLNTYGQFATEVQSQTAIKRRNSLEFNLAKAKNTIMAYQAFIDKRPTAYETTIATQLRDSIAYVDAVKKNTIESYQSFITKYPNAKEAPLALANIHRIAYAIALDINTEEAYQSFIASYPNAKEVEDARERIQILKSKITRVSLIVSADGSTMTEAINNALRWGIEQTYGSFVSSNTEIFSTPGVNEEIATDSSGNIKTYELIESVALPNGDTAVMLEVIVDVLNLEKYAETKGYECEFSGALFGANLRLYDFYKRNEKYAIQSMIRLLDAMRPVYDYKIKVADPILNSGGRTAKIEMEISLIQTPKSQIFNNTLRKTFMSLMNTASHLIHLQDAGFEFTRYKYYIHNELDFLGYLFNDDILNSLGVFFREVLYDYAISDNLNGIYFELRNVDTTNIHLHNGNLNLNVNQPYEYELHTFNIDTGSMTLHREFIMPIQDIQRITKISIVATNDSSTNVCIPNIISYNQSSYLVDYLFTSQPKFAFWAGMGIHGIDEEDGKSYLLDASVDYGGCRIYLSADEYPREKVIGEINRAKIKY